MVSGSRRGHRGFVLSLLTLPLLPGTFGEQEVKSDILVACTHYNEALLFAVTAEALDYMPKAMVFTVGPARGDFVDDVGLDASRFIIGPTQVRTRSCLRCRVSFVYQREEGAGSACR